MILLYDFSLLSTSKSSQIVRGRFWCTQYFFFTPASHQLATFSAVCFLPCNNISETNQAPKSGTDVLLDLLSIGTPTAQSTSPMLDILSSGQDNKLSEGIFDQLAPPSASSAPSSSPIASSSMMDLLDGFGPSPSVPGMIPPISLCSFLS